MNYHHANGRFEAAHYGGLNTEKNPKDPLKRKLVDINSWGSQPFVAPAKGLLLFYVGTVCDREMHSLIAALNKSRTGTGIVQPSAYSILTADYSFFAWENIDQGKPATRLFASPKSNEWVFSNSQYTEEVQNYERSHPIICAFINGWMASHYDENGHRRGRW